MREHPIKAIKDKLPAKASSQVYDAVIVWKEGKQKSMAFDVILEPAQRQSPKRPFSPPKERPLSQELIELKLKSAETRRQSIEAEKIEKVARQDKIKIAQHKAAVLEAEFQKEAEIKMLQRQSSMQEGKNRQINALQERLRVHAQRVNEVRAASDNYRSALKENVEKKMQEKTAKRENHLKSILEKLQEHEHHVKEVLETSAGFSKRTEEKMMSKMEATLKNREGQIEQLMERLKDHEKHVQQVRMNKSLNMSASESMNMSASETREESTMQTS